MFVGIGAIVKIRDISKNDKSSREKVNKI